MAAERDTHTAGRYPASRTTACWLSRSRGHPVRSLDVFKQGYPRAALDSFEVTFDGREELKKRRVAKVPPACGWLTFGCQSAVSSEDSGQSVAEC